jgi:hypothetical protein
MKKVEFEPHERFGYKTTPKDILIGLVVSNLFVYLGSSFDYPAYILVGLVAAFGTLFLTIRLLRPDEILVGMTQIRLPKLIPGKFRDLKYHEIEGHWLREQSYGVVIFIQTKDGRILELRKKFIQNWPRFYDVFSERIPILKAPELKPPAGKRLLVIATVGLALTAGLNRLDLITNSLGFTLAILIVALALLTYLSKGGKT